MAYDVVVIGSINHDVTIRVDRHPTPGETVLARDHYWALGGKGANQAVAAARMGARVAMIGSVGNDASGRASLSALDAEGIERTGVQVSSGAGTGLAVITVDRLGENTIGVSPGANFELSPEHVHDSAATISRAKIVLAQLEVPLETVKVAAALASGRFLLNPAPFQPLPRDLLERCDLLIPNETELSQLGGDRHPDPATLPGDLGLRGSIVATFGANGARIIDHTGVTHVPSHQVEPVDPTGAGDAFCGTLGAGLAAGLDLRAATVRAVAAGALATTRAGAQPSLPALSELEAFLDR